MDIKVNRFMAVIGNAWVIAALLVVITLLHFSNWGSVLGVHEFLRRLYFLPIILAAFRYGLSGGLITSLLAGLLYAPHLLMYVGKAEIQIINQVMEIVVFIALGIITGVLSDIQMKQQAELERQLNQVHRLEKEIRIADRLAAVGQLASGVAHEIRNPLGIIKAAAQLAKPETADNPDALESIEVIIKEVDRANQVVSQLLDFAKPYSPQFLIVNLVEIIDDAILITRQYAGQHGVILYPEIQPREIFIEADAEQLKQVLVNLILNAIQATPSEGKVFIKTSKQVERKESTIDGVLLEISDTGIGIPAELISRVFDPFYTSKEKGAGLGLSIVYSIVQDHAGHINIESQAGQGTSVSVWLPRAKEGGRADG